MPKIITVTSGKGGVGKSSLSTGLSRAFRQPGGQTVLLIELDVGLRGVDVMLGLTDRVVYDLGDVLAGRCYPGRKPSCPARDGRPDYSGRPRHHRRGSSPPLRCSSWSPVLRKRYDHVLIDTPAGLGVRGHEPACRSPIWP